MKIRAFFAMPRTRDMLLNGLIVALVLVLFLQCGVYFVLYAGSRSISTEIPFDMRMLSASTEGELTLSPELLIPEAIAIRGEDEGYHAVFTPAAVVEDVYTEVNRCLASAIFAPPSQVGEAKWQEALPNCVVYIRYARELPYQVIAAFAAASVNSDSQIRRGDPYIGVREIVFEGNENGTFRYLLLRGESGVYRFPLICDRDAEDFAGYVHVYPEAFCRAQLVENDDVCVLETEETLSARVIYASSWMTTLLIADPDFLRVLDYNPDKLNYHVESDGTHVYVESHGILRSNAEELRYEAAEDGGIAISGMGGGETADIYAYLRVGAYLIERLDAMSLQNTGGDARLYLERVSAEAGTVRLHFALRCDNITLSGQSEEYGLTLYFRKERLVGLRYRMLSVRRDLEVSRVMLQSWYKRMLGAPEHADMRLVYVMDPLSYGLRAIWSVMMPAEDAEGG